MIRVALLSLVLLVPCSVLAQQLTGETGGGTSTEFDTDANAMAMDDDLGEVREVVQPVAAVAGGALLRGLDRVSGALTDLRISNGEIGRLGSLDVTLGECRYPVDNPSGDAYAYLVIRDHSGSASLFEGWMIASSPALNAMDHRRYDVWVLRCIIS